jgi:DNA replication licensing factor MCM4
MRKAGIDSRTQEKRITATTRQLESMIRLSEAHARMRWSEEVELEDVEEANRLIKSALRESAVSFSSFVSNMDSADPQTDPLTGQIDLDLINTGAGSATRRIRGDLRREVCLSSSPTWLGHPLHPQPLFHFTYRDLPRLDQSDICETC